MEAEVPFVAPGGPLFMMLIIYWGAVILYFRLRVQEEARNQVLRATNGLTHSPMYVGMRVILLPLLAALLLPFVLAVLFFR